MLEKAGSWTEVAVVADDLPIEQHIFHFWTLSDIVDDHITAARPSLINHDPYMSNPTT